VTRVLYPSVTPGITRVQNNHPSQDSVPKVEATGLHTDAQPMLCCIYLCDTPEACVSASDEPGSNVSPMLHFLFRKVLHLFNMRPRVTRGTWESI